MSRRSRQGPAIGMDDHAWLAEPAEEFTSHRYVGLFLDISASGTWAKGGIECSPEWIPGVPILLAARIWEWQARYTWWDRELPFEGAPVEYNLAFPIEEFNAEGEAIAQELRKVLGPDWTVEHRPLRRSYDR